MATVAALVFAAGVLLAVRVMFFGVRRSVGEDFVFRASRLAAAAAIVVAGAMLYLWHRVAGDVTVLGASLVLAASVLAGGGAWWLVRASAAVGSTDPEDDPRYMFQGFVGRVVQPITDGSTTGRITLELNGKQLDLGARWSTASGASFGTADIGTEVVIELVDGDVAYVEPWALVEGRL